MQHCWCPTYTYLLCYRRQFNATSCLLTFLHDVACSKEETLFFPWLAKKVTLPERFSADHATLMEQLKACGQALAQLKSTKAHPQASRGLHRDDASKRIPLEFMLISDQMVSTGTQL